MASENRFHNQFSWDELNEITDQFNIANFIGESADFQFFRGIVPQPSQLHVTVKVWKDSVTFQDKLRHLKEESTFFAPPEAVKCSNVVNVVGYCYDGDHIGAVYKINSVSTLENYLAQDVDGFQWLERMIVALGIARLFCFLQHFGSTHIIHWALPACVILDQEMNPVLCDIGLLTSGVPKLIEGPGDSRSRRTPPSSEDARLKMFGMFSFGMLVLRIICREDVVKQDEHENFSYFRVLVVLSQNPGRLEQYKNRDEKTEPELTQELEAQKYDQETRVLRAQDETQAQEPDWSEFSKPAGLVDRQPAGRL